VGFGVAVHDGGGAEGGHGRGHGGLGDGVHRGRDAGDGERHAAGEARGEVDGVGGEADVPRQEDDVVVGVGDALREEPRRREAVVGEVGPARRHWLIRWGFRVFGCGGGGGGGGNEGRRVKTEESVACALLVLVALDRDLFGG